MCHQLLLPLSTVWHLIRQRTGTCWLWKTADVDVATLTLRHLCLSHYTKFRKRKDYKIMG